MIVMATNPVFLKGAINARIEWAGLTPRDFDHITYCEDTHYCKPTLEYYREIMGKIGKQPEKCMMVGNDIRDDMVAERLGMQTFLMTAYLLNPEGKDITRYNKGGFSELEDMIKMLPYATVSYA
jgi:FMN phosphatase YigB (HAD superfamily)